jgi:hypothetical protein
VDDENSLRFESIIGLTVFIVNPIFMCWQVKIIVIGILVVFLAIILLLGLLPGGMVLEFGHKEDDVLIV